MRISSHGSANFIGQYRDQFRLMVAFPAFRTNRSPGRVGSATNHARNDSQAVGREFVNR